ncbi:MAG: ABC-F family ATP-binding cassette domain-containing protein [Candidatus Moranbacteria bacterium]|nr:ABC-F family ATP-binding cassette domain-containing protein [Candidatus Moranbacteria bacterium]
MSDHVVLRFDGVTFEYGHKKPLLDEVSFSVRKGSKITLMGQNGAGKSTLFKLVTRELVPTSGRISLDSAATVAIGRQTIPRDRLDRTIRDFLAEVFPGKDYELDKRAKEALEVVNLDIPLDRALAKCSGGQQARILLASALIQDPDILLLDEPTNNLDAVGIAHLTAFLSHYDKTVLVISHDADFLNAFTDGVLYLDVHTRKIDQFVGNYYDVVEEIKAKVEKAERENARLEKTIKEKRDQANVFANKGGKLRGVAKRMRTLADDLEENKAVVRREDKTLPSFEIACPDVTGPIITIKSVSLMRDGEPQAVPVNLVLKRNTHLFVSGPNGIGKSTFLESVASGDPERVEIADGVSIGYYRQDFSTLDFGRTVFDTLLDASPEKNGEIVYKTAARFLIPSDLVQNEVGSLSEGQKGLLMLAKLFLEQPSLLILDEPTNHMNFRHIPVIAEALDAYKGTLIFVSHVPDFYSSIRIDEVLDLESL